MSDSRNPSGVGRAATILAAIAVLALAACLWLLPAYEDDPVSGDPVVISMWHNRRAQVARSAGETVDRFNRTEGRKQGIVLSVTFMADASVLDENLEMIANDEPGALSAPDLATMHPKIAALQIRKQLLADIGSHFSERELDAYVPGFLEEGRGADGKLYIFPIAKSTEALFVNRTFFDRFASETGTTLEQLSTFEGLVSAAEKYYEWTDARTPGTADDGKAFFMFESLFNFTEVGFRQMGGNFSEDDRLNLSSPLFEKVWKICYEPAVRGYAAIHDSYGAELAKTGDIVCFIGSTAGIAFCPSIVTYPDNSTEPVSFDILPYPVFEGGAKIAIQRGDGFGVFKSTPRKERAAAVFLKWLTEPEENLSFLASSGYIPVAKEACDRLLERRASSSERADAAASIYEKFLHVASIMWKEYDFLIPTPTGGDYVLQKGYESRLKQAARLARGKYRKLRETKTPDAAFRTAVEGAYAQFTKQ